MFLRGTTLGQTRSMARNEEATKRSVSCGYHRALCASCAHVRDVRANAIAFRCRNGQPVHKHRFNDAALPRREPSSNLTFAKFRNLVHQRFVLGANKGTNRVPTRTINLANAKRMTSIRHLSAPSFPFNDPQGQRSEFKTPRGTPTPPRSSPPQSVRDETRASPESTSRSFRGRLARVDSFRS